MTWKHSILLWFLPALAGLLGFYLWTHRRVPDRGTVRFPTWAAALAATHGGRRRYLAPTLFMLALVAAVLGAADPVIMWPAPAGRPVALIIDVSRSMEETDIPPTRIEAAKTAAIEFVRHLPRGSKVTLVSFGNYATVVVPLTTDRRRLEEGIRGLATQLRTQLGTGLAEGVRAVIGEEGLPSPVPSPRAIAVLLSDGRASDGIPPLEAAAEARRRGVRVYTVGVGTAADPRTLRSGYWGVLDEPTLRAIASQTGGQYFHAAAADRLRVIYRDLARMVGWERRPTEAAAIMGAVAAMLLITSVAIRHLVSPMP
jgi:Ca-activated chloride channel family protein